MVIGRKAAYKGGYSRNENGTFVIFHGVLIDASLINPQFGTKKIALIARATSEIMAQASPVCTMEVPSGSAFQSFSGLNSPSK
jgi:hypothetical protein